MSNSSMIEVMIKDGKYALKQYLPNICGVLRNPNQDPSTIIAKLKEYSDVFQGCVKDHFLIQRHQVGHGIWQEVNCFQYYSILSFYLHVQQYL